METHLMYNGNRLIPAPLVNLTKTYNRTQDNRPIGTSFRIVLTGTTVAYMGSPDSAGAFWTLPGYPSDETITNPSRLRAIIRKIEAIRELFSIDGYQLEIQSGDGSQPMKCNPRVIDINFAEGLWYDRVNYTITLEADIVYINGTALGEDAFTDLISDANEQWNFETDETPEGIGLPRTYRLSHTVSAVGKTFYDETGTLTLEAWKQARSYVLQRLGYSAVNASNSGINNLPSYYGGYNFMRTSQQDELAGSFSATENWLLASGKALEQFNCDIKSDASNGTTNVVIQGTITGLEERTADMALSVSKYANADIHWSGIHNSLLSRAQYYAGINLNPFPLSRLVGKNDINGTITYSYEYDSRPTNMFSGVSYESISINEIRPSDLFASIPVIGRANGPVLQGLGSVQERAVTLNIELITTPNSYGAGTVSELRSAFYGNPRIAQPVIFDNIIQAARPSLNYLTTYEFVRSQNETWDSKTGRWNYSIEWIFGN